MTVNRLIWVATIISIATYQLWLYLPKGSYYLGMAIFIMLISIIIFVQNHKLFSSFFLLCIAFNNLLDELFFNPEYNGVNEIVIVLILPIIWYLKNKRNARKNYKQ
jgi:hypothetical protein